MRRLMRRFIGVSVAVTLILAAAMAIGGLFRPAPDAAAQEADQCTELVSQAVTGAREVCAALGRGQACYGSAGVSGTLSDSGASFAAAGDRVDIAALDSLTTTAANPDTGEWGVAMLSLPAGLADGAVTAILFGEAQIARPAAVEGAAERPTLTVSNSSAQPINLRNGAGTNFTAVGQFQPGESLVADGRNAQGDWVRVQLADGSVAWVFTRLISWDGDNSAIQALQVLDPADVTPAFVSGDPFEAFTLVTGPRSEMCGVAPSGLLLQYTGEAPASLRINQVLLEFSDATLLVHAAANESLDVMVLSGAVTATARGTSTDASAGQAIQVDLGGDDGLTPQNIPALLREYAFAAIADAPVTLLGGEMACLVGLPVSTGTVTMRVGPGENRGPIANMNPNASYTVLGWANDPDGAPWWQLDIPNQPLWVPQSAVSTFGSCEVVAEVEPPPLIMAPPSAPSGDEGNTSAAPDSGVDDFAPAAQTVWQMYPGSDNMSGECSGAPAINFCDHLAAISPAQGGIMWRGMEASPYYLTRIQPNVYAYSGPNILGTGTVSMTLRFTSETTLTMTQKLTLTSEPNCVHTYNYTGEKNW